MLKKKKKQTDVEVEGLDEDEDMDDDPDDEPEEEPEVPKPEAPKPEADDKWVVGEVTTQTEPVIVNKKRPDKPLTIHQAIVVILNKLQRLEKLL